MAAKVVIVALFALLVGCSAGPTPESNDQIERFARIVGGVEAFAGSHPHMAALSSGSFIRSYLCGGSVISIRTILTAAHCIDAVFSFGSLSSSLRVTVGTNRWNSGGQTYALARNVSHPNYVSATIKNDIGLLITSANIAYSTLVLPIQLTFDQIPGGVPARVAGWGRIVAGGSLAANLRELEVPTLDGERCAALVAQASIDLNMRAPPVEPHIEICTFIAPAFGTCNGDSGSALSRVSDGRQIGIVSWGFPCARGVPDMFVRVGAFREWLEQNVV